MERAEVTNIYTMKDGTDDTDDYSGDLKKPASKSKRQTSKVAMKSKRQTSKIAMKF